MVCGLPGEDWGILGLFLRAFGGFIRSPGLSYGTYRCFRWSWLFPGAFGEVSGEAYGGLVFSVGLFSRGFAAIWVYPGAFDGVIFPELAAERSFGAYGGPSSLRKLALAWFLWEIWVILVPLRAYGL